ncbi:MAG: GNAT family N-acetyltransferase [Proteobacteria bacterium]|nr:GNAT family N-acetyltransferase [Pseudomonadota bacterium]
MNQSPRNERVDVAVARSIAEIMEAFAIRTLVYMGEQNCPYDEEYDGNDFAAATHLIARVGREPVGVMRLRWFADFCKVERVAVRREHRGGEVAQAMIEAACEIAGRKGYRTILGHIQSHLLPFWRRYGGVSVRSGRPRFFFSDHEYVEVVRTLAPHANALTLDTPAMVLLRPEGAWDEPGVLDRSNERLAPALL